MTTSLTTSEDQLRAGLLDIVYAQWMELGIPFSSTARSDSCEAIDPEALFWCSLEFLPTDPRLCEGVLAWLTANRSSLIRQRLRNVASDDDPRTNVWRALGTPWRSGAGRLVEACHGLESPQEVLRFCRELEDLGSRDKSRSGWLGKPSVSGATVVLQARNLLGGDLRHLLLVYLLANPGGSLLREIKSWSGYSYRSISETVTRWTNAGVLRTDHGFCRLDRSEAWHDLLRNQARGVVIVDWFAVFDAVIGLLRALAVARRRGLAQDGAVIATHRRETRDVLASAICGEPALVAPSLASLSDLLEVSGQR